MSSAVFKTVAERAARDLPGGSLCSFQQDLASSYENEHHEALSSLALAFALIVPVGFVGCGDEAKDQVEITQETPAGTTTETITEKVETSGENPPEPVVADPATTPEAAPE